jgi:hypothetical protein
MLLPCLLGLLFHSEEGEGTLLREVGNLLTDFTTFHSRTRYSSTVSKESALGHFSAFGKCIILTRGLSVSETSCGNITANLTYSEKFRQEAETISLKHLRHANLTLATSINWGERGNYIHARKFYTLS